MKGPKECIQFTTCIIGNIPHLLVTKLESIKTTCQLAMPESNKQSTNDYASQLIANNLVASVNFVARETSLDRNVMSVQMASEVAINTH